MTDPIDISGRATYQHGQLGGINGFIFHHTGGRSSPQGVVDTLNQRGLGVQYVMDRDGTIYRTLPAGARGAHIQDSPDGSLSNANTEGMEVIASNDGDITPAQVASAKAFATTYAQQHPGIQFYGHGTVNPGHKEATEGQTIISAIGGNTGSSTGTATATATPTGPDTRQLVFNALVKEGLTPQQALGSLWSMGGESHSTLDTNAYNPKDPGGSIGIAQWLGTRRKDLEAYATAQNKPVNDPNVQVGFLIQELRGNESHAFELLKQAKTPEDATRIWTKYFERPQVDNSEARIAAGKRVGTLDAQGSFLVGDAPRTTSTTTPASGAPTTQTPAPASGGDTPRTYPTIQITPEQRFDMSVGQALAGMSAGGAGGSSTGIVSEGHAVSDPIDQPAIRMPALDAVSRPTPDAVPAQYSQGLGGQLASLAAQPILMDPEANPANMQSITQGAPGMTALLGTMGTPSSFNYTDPRAAQPIPNSRDAATRGIRFA